VKDSAATALAEARAVLIAAARRRFGRIPPELVVDHVLATTSAADHPVREAALDALVRRMAFAVRDGLVVVSRPPRGAALGAYETGRAPAKGKRARGGPAARPYDTWLESLSPFAGSCDCPDYVRGSLGICKHLLVVLDAVHGAGERAVAAAAKAPPAGHSRARLTWDASLPLEGPLDRLAGFRLHVPPGATSDVPPAIRKCFEPGASGEGAKVRAAVRSDWAERAALLDRLGAALKERSPRVVATPSAWRVVTEERDRLARRVRCAAHAPDAERELTTLLRKLYPYQRAGVRRLLTEGRLLLADDMGLGKTTQAIAACHALFRSKRARRGLVIAPASLKGQWLREWQETTNTPVRVVDGDPEARRAIYREHGSGFLILGYEQLLRDFEHVREVAPDVVVIDEAQRIKNYATKSAAYVKALTPEYRFVLTGTPMENRIDELASILDWIDDVALAPKWRLAPWYTRWEGDAQRGKTGGRHLDTLRERIAGCTLRRVRREVLSQLPSRTDTRVPVEMTEQQRAAHDDLVPPIRALVAKTKTRPLTQPEFLHLMSLLGQQRIISNGLAQARFDEIWPTCERARPDDALLEGLFAPKLFELRRLLADLVIAQERKVVVFSQWRRMLRLAEWSARDVLAGVGARAVFFTGAETTAQRTRAVVDFHDDPNVRVMFLSDAGGVGLNLQRAASACINLELPWNPAVIEQRIGRIYRLGQKKPIDVYNLISEYGIESRIATLVGAKHALFAGLFDGTTDEVVFDGASSFLSRLEKLVEPQVAAVPARPSPPLPDASDAEDDAPELAARHAAPPDAGVTAAASPPVTPAGPFAELLASVRVERTEAGALRLEAPPHAAQALASVFETMARLLRASAAD